jgi:hypothetical protein
MTNPMCTHSRMTFWTARGFVDAPALAAARVS